MISLIWFEKITLFVCLMRKLCWLMLLNVWFGMLRFSWKLLIDGINSIFSSRRRLLLLFSKLTGVVEMHGYFFVFWAFSAALVVLPPEASLNVTALMTPTATVCLISRTAKRPNGGNSWNDSTHKGLVGCKMTIAASPDLMALGLSSTDLPERRSTFSRISANLQAMWAVWQSKTGV